MQLALFLIDRNWIHIKLPLVLCIIVCFQIWPPSQFCVFSAFFASFHVDSDVIVDQTGQLQQNETTPLHLAAKSGDATKTLELLDQGLNPCIRDERGKTPYTLATDKEVRNTFRRFMALNLDKWDWHAANVPSALTKEMEESQAAKQVKSFLYISMICKRSANHNYVKKKDI